MNKKIENYTKQLKQQLDKLPSERIEQLAKGIVEVSQNDRTVFVAGNGGSAATASHFVCDVQKTVLGERPREKRENRLKVICLNDNVPLMTAWANDSDYCHIFCEPLRNLGSEQDLAIFITGSGNSENILEGIKTAKEIGMKTHAWLGFDGGEAKDLVDDYILIPSNHYGIVEDTHMILVHLLTDLLKPTYSTDE